MTDAMVEALMALTDLHGVEGSFFATREGHVVARALPRYFDDEALAHVGPRLGRVLEALDDIDGRVEGTLSTHPNHAVLLRPAGEGLLCVIATNEVNVPSLKRAAALVARKVGHLATEAAASLAPPQASCAPPPPPPPSLPPPRPSVPGAPASRARRWRGSTV